MPSSTRTAANRRLTDAERKAKARLAHGRPEQAKPPDVTSPPGLMIACIPRGPVEISHLQNSAASTMVLYDRLVSVIMPWLDRLEARAVGGVRQLEHRDNLM